MRRTLKNAALVMLVGVTAAGPALADGPVGTLPRGSYDCELPGDAAGPAGIPQPDANFTIRSSSRYSAGQGAGTYLKRGDKLTLSSGPRRGENYAVAGTGTLRRTEGDKPTRLRCIHARER